MPAVLRVPESPESDQLLGISDDGPLAAGSRGFTSDDPADASPSMERGDGHRQLACQVSQPPFACLQAMNIRRTRRSRSPADLPFEQKATHYTFGELQVRLGGRKPSALSDAAISVSVLRWVRNCSMRATSS